MFWIKVRKNKKNKTTTPHRLMKGLRGKGLHDALDFAIEHNKWPFKFKYGGINYDMTIPFILVTWCHYIGNMASKPRVTSKAAQKVSTLYELYLILHTLYLRLPLKSYLIVINVYLIINQKLDLIL